MRGIGKSHVRAFVPVLGLIVGTAAKADPDSASKQALFERVFGVYAKLDPTIVAKVKALKPGTRYYVDRTAGHPAEVWFIDTDLRHQKRFEPILVRVIDEDGDLVKGGEPDHDGDLYLADWHADGTVDAVISYQDDDGDGDVDEMGTFFYAPTNPYLGKASLCVWWDWDVGDRNLVWYDVNYTYQQRDCQWRTHFGGDEMFCAFALTPDGVRWEPLFEDPFLFYDTDGDGESEVVVRISGKADHVESIRYSFDADNASRPTMPHHYDFSLTALAPGCTLLDKTTTPGKSSLHLDSKLCTTTRIRGIPTGPFLARDRAIAFANTTQWARTLLTWDENDMNTDGDYEHDSHLRWEGVIAHSSKNFPQIGGPPCGPANKRNELDTVPNGPTRLYYDPADRRIHLRGADEGWIDVDYDLDHKVDMRYMLRDIDSDGVLEVREIDTDADGKPELILYRERPVVDDVWLNEGHITDVYRAGLQNALAANQSLIDLMKAVLRAKEPAFAPDAVEQFYVERLAGFLPEQRVGERMRASRNTARYYQDIVRDRYYIRLEKLLTQSEQVTKLRNLYANGDFKGVARMITEIFAAVLPQPPVGPEAPGGGLFRRPGIRLSNPKAILREGELVTVPVEEIRKAAPDFKPAGVAVLDGERWLDWRRIPHQVDKTGPGEREELCFLASVDPEASKTYWLGDAAKGEAKPAFPNRTATAQDWVPPNIGWESERICYRAYWGQFDFFGKKIDRLILPTIGHQSYHEEVEWGIDALNVGTTSGLGGLTLYVGDREYLVQNPEGKGTVEFSKRALVEGPVRTVIEFVGEKVGPYRVRVRCTAIAGRQESPISVLVTGPATSEPVCLAPGFIRLGDERMVLDTNAGVFATWGRQTTAIGTIGMALLFDPEDFGGMVELSAERRVKLRAEVGREMSYVIMADWLRGRQYPRSPTIENWHGELKRMSLLYRQPIEVEVLRPKTTK
jgi:hypothetical protein